MSARRIRRNHEQAVEREERRASRLGRRVAAGTGLALGATVLFAPAAQADTFQVTKLDDTDDGVCDADCSLREAADEANLLAGGDEITFASGLTGTITLALGEIPLLEEVTVTGPGAETLTVSGDDASRIFYVEPGVNGADFEPVTISGLTLSEGYDDIDGGALYSYQATLTLDSTVFTDNYAGDGGGAVSSDSGNLTVTNSVFTDNDADDGGGALYLEGTEGSGTGDVELLISDSEFSDNTAENDGGALYLSSADGDVVIESSSLTDNDADDNGGAIDLSEVDADATIDGNTLTGNSALYDDGGGLAVHDVNGGDLTIVGNTLSGNSADEGTGGGLFLYGIEGTTLIENTTVSGNDAAYDGGGIYFGYLYDDQETTIRNSTIVDNVAGVDPNDSGDYAGGGVYLYDDSDDPTDPINGPLSISSTIVANNSAESGGNDLGQGEFADGFEVGHSLIEDPDGAEISDDPAGSNLTGVDPELGALGANGGPTETHLPALSSPALDAGVANGLDTDQRGSPRTFDAVVIANNDGSDGTDMGAVELQPGENDLPGNAECKGAVVGSKTGTEGPDTITGSDASDALFGAGGNDTLNALGGADCVSGDAGNDKADAGGGKDLVLGGAGKDKLNGRAGKDNVKGEAGKDRLSGSGGADKLKGSGGKDKANGGGGKDKVSGGAGKDKLKGGPGKDKLKGNGGKDKINAVDGKRDKVNCGGGNDRAKVDAKDKVSPNCEVVKVKGS